MDDDNEYFEAVMEESQSLEKQLLDLKKETKVLIKDIEVFRTDQEKLLTENNQLEDTIMQKTEFLKIKYNERKNMEQLRTRVDHFEEMLRNVASDYDSRVKELSDKNSDLEESLELMRHEFEEMENYWQKKIEDERSFYDQQIKLEEGHFRDLELKILEYERFSIDQPKNLYTIQEGECLEDEVAILEGELEELRDHMKKLTQENRKLRTQIMVKKQKFIAEHIISDNRETQSLPCEMYMYL